MSTKKSDMSRAKSRRRAAREVDRYARRLEIANARFKAALEHRARLIALISGELEETA